MRTLSQRLAAAMFGLALVACGANAAGDSPESVKAAVEKKIPGRPVTSVRATPIKGIYEVVFGPKQVVYTDARGDYMLVGDLVDIKQRISLTEQRIRELSRTDFAKLPLDKALKLVRGNGARKVAVFSDPDCPFCRKLERDTIAKLDNVTVYTFLYPLKELHPDAARKSALIWCADERQKAWQEWMFEGKLPANDGSCATPVADLLVLGEKLGVTGTPTMVFENGEVLSGAIEAADFEARLVAKK